MEKNDFTDYQHKRFTKDSQKGCDRQANFYLLALVWVALPYLVRKKGKESWIFPKFKKHLNRKPTQTASSWVNGYLSGFPRRSLRLVIILRCPACKVRWHPTYLKESQVAQQVSWQEGVVFRLPLARSPFPLLHARLCCHFFTCELCKHSVRSVPQILNVYGWGNPWDRC